ncbi:MAG TPA: 3-hydroxyacyl-CoA dehydrogenase NAD-binding domain-containing protein [Gemmatimonadaceae bacterium]|nr:3-hydroxyacyl-CoA dehydrogenase NAD-binding domain-containing protein [Gemmatimonadaceae bacterium]
MPLDNDTIVGVIGAGAMGTGIAQVAAAAGHRVVLGDAAQGAAQRAQARIAQALERDVAKERVSRDAADEVLARIQYHWEPLRDDLSPYRECGLVIEAVVEDFDVKRSIFRRLEGAVSEQAVLATNTSSLSVTSIAAACQRSDRVIGLHFFNPAPVMPLVEVVPWVGGDAIVASSAFALMQRWRKVPVLASDTPGFIVNRIARPFYGEAIRMLEEGVADCATIDWAMKEFGGFRMGPFELMDFIGNDVNFAVTRSVFEAFFYEPRYRPSLTQQRLVEAGFLGRKSGRGYYVYREGVEPPQPRQDPNLGLLVFERILAMLINEAVDAVFMQVASPTDVDLAMTKGVNYPKGLLAWANEIGLERVLGWLERLHQEYGEDRYRPSPLLRRMVRDGRRFFE